MTHGDDEQLNGNNKDDLEIDEYCQIKTADIHLLETLSVNYPKDTVEEYTATVDCGGRQRSVTVRMYTGDDANKVEDRIGTEFSSLMGESIQSWISGKLTSQFDHSHLNVTQLLAVCNSKGLPALIFDEGKDFSAAMNIDDLKILNSRGSTLSR
ncbi:hypothetical protein M422DRAFT_266413 [Sphaerobolus stellatus SS14]|uniref:Uncharacterized protein n=1 Tax=Sphaerobolus stellatus (strain SS14) TaxID=990650 RepID=A0A0C9V393_SPHS4|nr:hypothetical protein M422DRAFT_266413 [Sphaerobolus stellatus SS14]